MPFSRLRSKKRKQRKKKNNEKSSGQRNKPEKNFGIKWRRRNLKYITQAS